MVDFLFFKILRGSGGVQEHSALFLTQFFLKTSVIIYLKINLNFRIFILQIPEKYEYIARMELSELTCLLFFALRNEVRIISRLHLTRR